MDSKQYKKIEKVIKKWRKSAKRSNHNELKLLDNILADEEEGKISPPIINVSISTRGDGKSFGYTAAIVEISKIIDMSYIIIARHDLMINTEYENHVKILEESGILKDPNDLYVRKTSEYLYLEYDGHRGYIISLTNSTDIKKMTNLIKESQFIIYDEFIVEESDYMFDEFKRLMSIFNSVDRPDVDRRGFAHPQIFLLGNAINFSSPVLSGLDILDDLADMKENTILHIKERYIVIEYMINRALIDRTRSKAVKALMKDDYSMAANYGVNRHLIATRDEIRTFMEFGSYFEINIDDFVMEIYNFNNKFLVDLKPLRPDQLDKIKYTAEVKNKTRNNTLISIKNFDKTAAVDNGLNHTYFRNGFVKTYYLRELSDINLNQFLYKRRGQHEIMEGLQRENERQTITERLRKRIESLRSY